MFHRERHLHLWLIGTILALGAGAHVVRGQSDPAKLTLEASQEAVHIGSALDSRSGDLRYRLPPELEGRARITKVQTPKVADPNGKARDGRAEWEAPAHPTDLVVEVINDEAVAHGLAASVLPFEAVVFNQPYDSGYGWFVDNTPGTVQWHQMIMEGSFQSDDTLSSFVARIHVSAANPGAFSGTGGFTLELWDGDPLGIYDTACSAGGVPAAIPGTTCTFSDLPEGVVYDLKCVFSEKVAPECDRVYGVVWPGDVCHWSWRLSEGRMFDEWVRPPQMGDGDAMGITYACEQYGECITPSGYNAGTCCDDQAGDPGAVACDHTDANPMNWTPAGGCNPIGVAAHPTFCQDDGADFTFLAADEAPVYYNTFVGQLFAQTDVVMQVIPMSVDAPPPNVPSDVTISGNSVTIDQAYPGGERHLWFEIYVSDWDPGDTGLTVKAWQAGLDASGYTAGLKCTLTPWRPPCTTDADCIALQGEVGSAMDILKGGCNLPGLPAGQCAAAFAPGREDFIFYMQGYMGGIDQSTLNYRYGATLFLNAISSPHIGDMYLGSLTLKTMCDCPAGDFFVGMKPPNEQTNMVQGPPNASQFIPLLGVVGADIHFPTGQCCNISEDPTVCISDTVTRCECDRMGRAGRFAVAFNPTGTCDDDCSGCVEDEDCDDNNICTLDTCRESACNHRPVSDLPCNDGNLCTQNDRCAAGICVADPIECPPGNLCDPGDGTCKECYNAIHCDDGNSCTDDACVDAGCTNELNYDDALYCCHPADGTQCAKPAEPTGDFDGDGDTDLLDFAEFQACFGSDPVTGFCDGVDLDCDCALNEHDTDDFVSALTGP